MFFIDCTGIQKIEKELILSTNQNELVLHKKILV